MLCLTNVTLLSITTPCARRAPWSWASAATPVMAAEKSGSDEHQAEQRPHSVATHRSISRPVGSATREHVGTASTVTNHREQRRFLAHFQQLSGPEHAHGSPRGLDGFFLHPADPSPALEKVASLHCLTARQLRRRRRKRQSGGGLARAFGKAPGVLSARNCVPRPMTSTRVVLLRRRRARHEDDEASRY